MKQIFFGFSLCLFSASLLAEQWVTGDVAKIQEYGAYSGGQYEILIKLNNQNWFGSGDGAEVCTERFRIKEGELGVTSDIKNRMFSMLLANHMASKSISLFVKTESGPFCNVSVVGIGEESELP